MFGDGQKTQRSMRKGK